MPTPRLNGPGSGPVPDLGNLASKSDAEVSSLLSRYNLQPDYTQLGRDADRAWSKLDAVIDEGVVPDDVTVNSVLSAIESAFTGSVRRQTKSAIFEYRMARMRAPGNLYTWVSIVEGSCPSCLDRHGMTKTEREWADYGEPGSTALLCGAECRCILARDALATLSDNT